MNLGQLSTWAAQNKPAVIGVGAAGAVGLGLLARSRAGGDTAGTPQHASYSAGGQADAAAGSAGVYDSSALDLYAALSPELASIGQSIGKLQEQLDAKPPTPVPAPPVAAPKPPAVAPKPAAPRPTPTAPKTSNSGAVYYTVKRGDNLSKIGKQYGLSWQDIYKRPENRQVIGTNPNLIYAGQKIRVK